MIMIIIIIIISHCDLGESAVDTSTSHLVTQVTTEIDFQFAIVVMCVLFFLSHLE